uniref:50S ribosomal protein L12, chloroplastic n=1 Tax=Rhodosorus marinus TaxID=101924 RepID=A0A7S3E6W2_9RHOD|mmetsp:Transcript_1040/g.2743  ORF Transcript_1040/g.2743 Transcript_1040/m.2743 type:complete len:196 (+) Transcript_1040:301-888(+)
MLVARVVRGPLRRYAAGEQLRLAGCGVYRSFHSGLVWRNSEAVASDERSQEKPTEKIGKLLDDILALNMLEVRELTTHLKDKLGVGDIPMGMPMAAQPVAAAAPATAAPAGDGGAASEEPKAEEKSVFTVKLAAFDQAKKIALIKEVRAVTGLGLKEAKALVDEAPNVVREGVPKDEAQELKAKLEELGGTVDLE